MVGTILPFSVPLCMQMGQAALIAFPQLMPTYSMNLLLISQLHREKVKAERSATLWDTMTMFLVLLLSLSSGSPGEGSGDLLKHVEALWREASVALLPSLLCLQMRF